MKTAIIIPARYASTRLPAKALLNETGKYLVEHVYEQALKVKGVETVVVATDDERIRVAVEGFGGKAVMTSVDHPSGTDRVAEAARDLDVDAIVNLQGDEPLIDPHTLEVLIDQLRQDPTAQMATLAVPIRSDEMYRNPNCVKVVRDLEGRALYFSRSPIPYVRDASPDFAAEPARFLLHLGLYAYRKQALFQLAKLPPHPLEEQEKLEQLRALGNGWTIRLGVVPHTGRGVDTPEDYARFVAEYRASYSR